MSTSVVTSSPGSGHDKPHVNDEPATLDRTPPRILLSFDGAGFIAHVLDVPECVGRGATYCEALKAAELALAKRNMDAGEDFHMELELEGRRRAPLRRYVPTVKAQLVARFGHMSNRRLAERIGIVAKDAPVMLSSAFSGRGSRGVRCLIAIALATPPSQLWPLRPDAVVAEDDAEYRVLLALSC